MFALCLPLIIHSDPLTLPQQLFCQSAGDLELMQFGGPKAPGDAGMLCWSTGDKIHEPPNHEKQRLWPPSY